MKHKHADLIHAWADGAEIQMLTGDGEWVSKVSNCWIDDFEYRIKPEEKSLWCVGCGLISMGTTQKIG